MNDCLWGEERNTVMHLAYLLNQPELTQQLLDKGALTDIPNQSGHLPTKSTKTTSSTESLALTESEPEVKLLINNNKVKSARQLKDRIPANASDRFKRLRELAESPNAKKPLSERQNSTRRYFRPGHLEERKRQVLSEEEEAELEKQRLKRQKEVELLAQRSAVKNNPLFKKFEEQSQQKDKPAVAAPTVSAIRDRKKLLDVAEQVRRSSRVINSLKDRSYVSGSVFRQAQPADTATSNTLHVPSLAQLRAGAPVSRDTSPNVSDDEDEDEVKPKKAETSTPAPTITTTAASVEVKINQPEPSTSTKQQQNTPKSIDSKKDTSIDDSPSEKVDCPTDDQGGKYDDGMAITTAHAFSSPSGTRSPIDQSGTTEDEIESLAVGKLSSKLNPLAFKSRNNASKETDITSSKVKDIVNVHEHLNDEEEVEIYSTGKKFATWKRDDDSQSVVEDMTESNKANINKKSNSGKKLYLVINMFNINFDLDPIAELQQSPGLTEQPVKMEKEANATLEDTTSSKPTVPVRSKSRPTSKRISLTKVRSIKDDDTKAVGKSLSDKKAIFDKKPEDENQPTTPKKLSNTSIPSNVTAESASDPIKNALLLRSNEEQLNATLQTDASRLSDKPVSLDTTSTTLVSSVTLADDVSLKTLSPKEEKKSFESKTDTTWKPRNKIAEKPTVDVQQKKQMFDIPMTSSLETNTSASKSNTTATAFKNVDAAPSLKANKNDTSSYPVEDINSDAKDYAAKDIISRSTSSSSSNSTASSYSNVANTPITSNNDRHFHSADITSPMIHDTNNFQVLDRTETYSQSMEDDTADNSKALLASTVPHVLLENRTIGTRSRYRKQSLVINLFLYRFYSTFVR